MVQKDAKTIVNVYDKINKKRRYLTKKNTRIRDPATHNVHQQLFFFFS